MDEERFIETVRREAPLASGAAAREVTEATLHTLGERITDGEAEDLARHLPNELVAALAEEPPGEAEPFPLEEFVARVSERAAIEESDVVPVAGAVATALEEAVPEAEFEAAREQLPPAFDAVVEPGGPATAEEFLDTIRERADLDSRDVARDVARATLRTLGERLTGGEAEDLAAPLPMEIDRYLLEAESGQRFDWQEFLDRVWEREGMRDPDDRADAAYHARAIMDIVAGAVPPGELEQVRDQLPENEDRDELFLLVDEETEE
jgi:uncharacterized protein (DUF2267 family)